MPIPKIIHSCWFGPGQKSDLARLCMKSWRQFAPDYQFLEWTESNSRKYQNAFFKDAIREKQYAFASDAIRVQVLQQYGGIYLDTDMLLLKPLDQLLKFDFFTGFEVADRPAYGIFGGLAGHRFFKEMANFYATERFNRYSPPVITHRFKNLISAQNLKAGEMILPVEVFYGLPYEKRSEPHQQYTNADSIAVHLWDHSWKAPKKETTGWLFKQIIKVHGDFYFRKYPRSYFKRYRKEFARKLYHKISGKS